MFSTIVHFTSLSWPRQGVDGSPLLQFSYEASPTVISWTPNDIPAHIDPIKNAGLGLFLSLLTRQLRTWHACLYGNIAKLQHSQMLPCSFPIMLNLTSEKARMIFLGTSHENLKAPHHHTMNMTI